MWIEVKAQSFLRQIANDSYFDVLRPTVAASWISLNYVNFVSLFHLFLSPYFCYFFLSCVHLSNTDQDIAF
jgi:hypothetical protein